MHALTLAVVLMSLGTAAGQSDAVDCSPWQTCQQLALAAAERGDFESFHTIAWRTVQTGPRNDPELMYLLARAQSMSGRPHDALVMLRRLAERGIARVEAETVEDFRRVRALPEWPATLEALHKATASAVATPAPAAPPDALRPRAAPSTPASPNPRKREADLPASLEEALPLPAAVVTPVAMAYDAVSGRVVIADESSDTLKIVSAASTNAVNLVSQGWAGSYRTTAIAIDGRRGDLWVVGADASSGKPDSAIHRLQLISGRLLYRVALPAEAGPARFAAVSLSATSVFALDVEGRRVFELAQGGKTLRQRMVISVTKPTSLAVAGEDVAFVSHAGGIARLDLRRRSVPVAGAKGVDLRGLLWIEHYKGSLLGIQQRADGTLAAVRIRLDSRGRRATALEVLGPAASSAAGVMNGVLYFVEDRQGSRVVRSIPLS